jgi:hypothetical protein
MSRRKSEITGPMNERDFPYIVELELPPGRFRNKSQEFESFHRERRITIFAEAAAGTRESNSMSAFAFPRQPPRMPFRSASAARA